MTFVRDLGVKVTVRTKAQVLAEARSSTSAPTRASSKCIWGGEMRGNREAMMIRTKSCGVILGGAQRRPEDPACSPHTFLGPRLPHFVAARG